MQRWFLVLLLVAVFVVAPSTMAQGGNLLQDPGFEGEYTNRGRADLNVPAPWGLWFTDSPHNENWQNLEPVAFPHNGPGPNPHGGARAFNFNRGFATFTAAIYQQVSVPDGSNVTGSAWAHLRTCNIPDGSENCGSAVESGAYTRVGIDPNGGSNPYDSDVVWSPSVMPHDRWEQVTVSATATGGTVTLFLFVTQEWPSEINNVYWDDSSLSIGGAGGAAAPPVSGGTPGATVPPPPPAEVGFVVAQTPQADGSIIHTVQAGDTIDSIAVAYGLTRDQLLALNPLANPRIIQIGQQLTVRAATGESTAEATAEALENSTPAASGSAAPTLPAATATSAIGPSVYFVQPGDTLDSIAFAHGLTRADLMALNNITDPRIIQIGQQLLLRPEETPEVTPEATPDADSTSVALAEITDEPLPLLPEEAATAPVVSVASGEVLPAIDPAAGTASVCVLLFRDDNQNRLQEAGETPLAEGTITLLLDGEAVDEYNTDGVGEPYCFDDLAAGDYVAAATAPDGYGLTTPAQLRVRAAAGSDVTLAFGAVEGIPPEATPLADSSALPTDAAGVEEETQAASSTNPLNDNLGLIIFGAAGVVLVVGAGASLALRRR
jgi:LysM repeat protein